MLSVAAHDLGEYIRHYPHGKKWVERGFGRLEMFLAYLEMGWEKFRGDIVRLKGGFH